mgnify:CR=1 FL=1
METYTAELIWAASWAAFKKNSYEYIREGYNTHDGTKEVNKHLLGLYVRDPKLLSEDDITYANNIVAGKTCKYIFSIKSKEQSQ